MKFLLLFILFFLSACDDEILEPEFSGPYICNKAGKLGDCSQEEKDMVDGIRGIISNIRRFEPTRLQNFKQKEQIGTTRKVYFFGENHQQIIGQIENLAAMNYLASNGATLLLEGNDQSAAPVYNCGLALIFRIYKMWEWEKNGAKYDPFAQKTWLKNKNFNSLFQNTLPSYNISDLGVSKFTCYFWDNKKAIKQGLNNISMRARNESMIASISNHINQSNSTPLIVNTGFSHMPLGEYLIYVSKDNIYDNKEMEKFYKKVGENNINIGLSKIIYDYLIKNSISYQEFIHPLML